MLFDKLEKGDFTFQSTPSARRATNQTISQCATSLISIHALREESDRPIITISSQTLNFNPRPPRGERLNFHHGVSVHALFQSTPSARRATHSVPISSGLSNYFNPRPPRGERLSAEKLSPHHLRISIHALREESDLNRRIHRSNCFDFNPRPPRGERPRSPAFVHVA